MTRGCIALAAALAAVCTAPAETVKTASQPWVTNRIEQAVAPLREQIETNRAEIAALEARKADAEIVSTKTLVPTSSYWRVRGSNLMPQGENIWYYPRNQYESDTPYTLTYTNGVWRLTVKSGTMTLEAAENAEALPFVKNYYSYYARRYWTYETCVVTTTNRVAYAQESHTYAGGDTEDLGIVRSNSKLVIREVSAANGQRQFRLIRCE